MTVTGSIFLSSDQNHKTGQFYGYCFQGSDLVIGPGGYQDFIGAGRNFEPDCDGCYAMVEADATGSVVSTDFHGYFPIFYYRFGKHWIVAHSFEIVAREAHSRGWALTMRQHQLLGWSSSAAMLLSSTSAHTPFDEVFLLSYDEEIRIENGLLMVRKKDRKPIFDSYDAALGHLLSSWGGRMMTILNAGMGIRLDLSGGVDSRTVFSVLLWTLKSTGRTDLLHSGDILVNSNPGMREDYEIAMTLSRKFGFPLNAPLRQKYVRIEADASFAIWKEYNLARYSPHILPLTTQDSDIFTFPGVGGEEHRNFYGYFSRGPLGEYVASYRNLFPDMTSFGAWMGDLHSDVDLPVSCYDINHPASVRHYRRHRGRHHTAKQPASEFMGVLLGSRASYECSSFFDLKALESNQLLFDIMLNCNETLAHMRYDKPSKAPQQVNLEHLTRLSDVIPLPPGIVWRRQRQVDDSVSSAGSNVRLKAEVETALSRPDVIEILGENGVAKVRAQLADLKPSNNLHQNGHMFHFALLTEVVCRYRHPGK